MYSLTADHHLKERENIPIPYTKKIQGIIESVPLVSDSYLLGFFRQVSLPSFSRQEDSLGAYSVNDELTYAILEKVLTLLRQRNIKILALYVNEDRKNDREIERARKEKIDPLWRKFDVPSIDVPTRSEYPALYYKKDIHWNAFGNEWVAKKILSFLKTEENR